jgi:hypothetical protein
VQIKFVDGHTVDVTVPGKRAVLSHDHMGFVDRRSGRPNKQWDLLRALASCHGDVRWTDLRVRGRYEKRVQELSQALRTFFRLGDAPLKLDSKNHRWQARFSVLPED